MIPSDNYKVTGENHFPSVKDIPNIPEVLYKYRSWDAEFHKLVLIDRMLYFSSPKDFEDPLDCKIPTDYSLLTEQDIIDYYYNYSVTNNDFITDIEHVLFAIHWATRSPMRDPIHIKAVEKEHWDSYNQRMGVLSLTALPNNNDMWQKYANNHRGFCVGFNSKILFESLASGGGHVEYVDELPILRPLADHRIEHMIQVFFKERKWEFEQEYRTYRFWDSPAGVEQRNVKFPKEAIKEIFIGKDATQKSEEEIRFIVTQNLPHVDVLRLK